MKIKYKFNPDNTFFTSDTHLKHEKIIEYCSRPFSNIEEQDEYLIKTWNKTANKDSDILILGDFIHSGNISAVEAILKALSGRKWLIYGNHDIQNKLFRDVFEKYFIWRGDVANIEIIDSEYIRPNQFFLSHYPHMFWPKHCIHLHGHIHSGPNSTNEEQTDFHPLRYDVGVDNNDYNLLSYKEIMNIINNQIKEADNGTSQ